MQRRPVTAIAVVVLAECGFLTVHVLTILAEPVIVRHDPYSRLPLFNQPIVLRLAPRLTLARVGCAHRLRAGDRLRSSIVTDSVANGVLEVPDVDGLIDEHLLNEVRDLLSRRLIDAVDELRRVVANPLAGARMFLVEGAVCLRNPRSRPQLRVRDARRLITHFCEQRGQRTLELLDHGLSRRVSDTDRPSLISHHVSVELRVTKLERVLDRALELPDVLVRDGMYVIGGLNASDLSRMR